MRFLRLIKLKTNRRTQSRQKGVLPVRVRGKDVSGEWFESLAHTLDLTPTGTRLGALHRKLKHGDTLVVLFHRRRIEFTVMWTRAVDGREYQVGLQMRTKENDPWGLGLEQSSSQSVAEKSFAMEAA